MRIVVSVLGLGVVLALVVVLAWRLEAVQSAGDSQGRAAAPAARTGECTAEALSAHASAGTTITGAVNVPPQDGLPAYCQVDARVTTPGNAVNVRVRLPASWNGKFLFHGVGGYAGSVEPPVPPNVAASDFINSKAPGLRRGYAVASTDTGHQGVATDASWALNDRAKEIDFAHRGVHVSTVSGKALTAAFYGSPPTRAYFAGCSGGGRQALMAPQRYPGDFDGVIAVAPAVGTTAIHRTLVFQALLANPDAYIPASKLETISAAVLAACDASDGVQDGLVSNSPACKFQPETLLCREGDRNDCLAAGQVATLKKLYAGVSTKDGRTRTQGFPVGHESAEWARWLLGTAPPQRQPDGALNFAPARGQAGGSAAEIPRGYEFQDQYLRYLAFEQDDPEYDWRRFDFDRDAQKLEAMSALVRPTPDLRAFRERGGRLLVFHGWADAALSAYSTIDFYEEMIRLVGGRERADEFSRLYLAPGMGHCAGGPGPNTFTDTALDALEAWVERGQAPDAVVATHVGPSGERGRSRQLCPWPQVARYKGSGSIDEAASFACAAP